DALRLQPDFEEAQVGLAHALREAGSYRAAARVYGEVLARSSQNVQALEGLAICQWRLGRTEEAEQLLRKALEVQPVRKEAAVSLSHTMGDLLYSQRRYGEALDYWEKSLELDPTQSSLRTLVEDLRQYVARYGPSPR
ncbi:tetratricopeptide repeat protein, partial [Candidatus Sumerlaeota bacterium]|nr:tetratricopeptide repeat protein [Candidatus Sumerlaeota bacterium]